MNLPAAFIHSLKNIKGFNKEAFENLHQSGEQVTSIRINPNKINDSSKVSFFGKKEEVIPWSSAGYYLSERPSFTLDPLFHAGGYYVQEASSMFLEQALKQTANLSEPLKILDLCAAPGGKSTLIQSLISENSLLVSNEVIKARVNILVENITKWGAENVIVTNNDPKDFQRLPGYFDVIVVDAPCSGSGLFRKDPAAVNEWSQQNVQLCSLRQQRIIADAWPSLKDEGILIYSTCSFSEDEDEAIADWVMQTFKVESLRLMADETWGIVETESVQHKAYGYRFYPDKVKGEGFFIMALKKKTTIENNYKTILDKKKLDRISNKEAGIIAPYLNNPVNFFYIRQNEDVIAIPLHLERDLAIIQSKLYIKKAGIKIGQLIREELIPDHQYALSHLQHPSFLLIDTDRENALQYLRKQDVKVSSQQKGWAILTYQGLPLGLIKMLPNRINNYYPKDWRILNK